jgi:Secretion system C-terminal sorting domain
MKIPSLLPKTLTSVLLFICLNIYLQASPLIPVSGLLTVEGKIENKHHLSGTIDFSGFIPIIDDCNGLLFLPMPVSPGWNALGSGLNNTVLAIAISGSDVYVGGYFTDAGGNANADRIARWDGNTWNALGSGLNNPVQAIAISGSNVYVGGQFTDAGGNANADRIARWDGSTWNALGSGLNSSVLAIAISGSNVYVGGHFTEAGDNANANRIARWDGSSWNALGNGTSQGVRAIAISGSDVYIGGDFINVDGNPDADRIVRWDGSTWNALGSGLNNIVYAIAVSGSNVYVGGLFTDAGGISNADYIARWDGSTWNALGSGLNERVFAIAVSGGDVYVGGLFTDASGNSNADYIALWDGSSWNALGSGLSNWVFAIAVSGSDVYVGGTFTDAGGNPDADRIARWDLTPLPVELISFDVTLFEKSAHLNWQVATQTNNEGWDVEHSMDGISWERIGWVTGDGSSPTPRQFQFIHQYPGTGQNYYRLRQNDFDGDFEYSKMVSLTMEGQDDILVYPTLTTGIINMESSLEEIDEIAVYDAYGCLILQIKNNNTINLDNQPAGMYILKILNKGKWATRRVVKQ